jgi:hypothetical protein
VGGDAGGALVEGGAALAEDGRVLAHVGGAKYRSSQVIRWLTKDEGRVVS